MAATRSRVAVLVEVMVPMPESNSPDIAIGCSVPPDRGVPTIVRPSLPTIVRQSLTTSVGEDCVFATRATG
jgi:hypothetical protein